MYIACIPGTCIDQKMALASLHAQAQANTPVHLHISHTLPYFVHSYSLFCEHFLVRYNFVYVYIYICFGITKVNTELISGEF